MATTRASPDTHSGLAPDSAGLCAQKTAYTYVREDVAMLVPADALHILDVGCSNGALGQFVKRLVPARRVVGIEIDAEFAREAAKSLDTVIHADLETLDIDAALASQAPFDCIVCADVLEHLREPWRQLAALTRLLGPTGKLVVGLPNIRHHSALWAIWLKGRFPRQARGLFDATHLRWFTYADCIDLLRGVGFAPEAAAYNVRIGDRGGGLANRLAGRLLDPIAGWWPIREFFVYQFVIRAGRADPPIEP